MSVALNETAHLSNLSYVNVSLLLAHLPRASSNGNYFNVTRSSSSMNTTLNPLDYSKEQLQMIQLVLGPLYPILLACCTIGNVLNLIVLFREKTKGSTNVFMMSVAISDLFILWLQLPYYLYNISLTIRAQVGFRKSYKDYDGVRRWGQETFMQLSDWTLIVFSLARLMAIVKPFSFRWLQTARTARIACAILLVLAGIFTIYIPIQWYCQYYRVPKTAKDPPWLTHWGAVQDQAEVAMTIFKFFALLVLNVVLVMAIRRQQTSHIGKMRAGQQSNSNRKYRNSNIILISSVLLYLVCQFPSLIVRLLTILDDIYHQYEFRKTHRQFANPFVLFALFGNYSVNFILYLMVSKKFRRQCAQLFAPCCGHPLVGKWRSRMSRLSTTRSRDDDDDGDSDDAEPQEMRISSITSNKDGVRLRNNTKSGMDRNGTKQKPNGTKTKQDGATPDRTGIKQELNGTDMKQNGTKADQRGTKSQLNGPDAKQNGTITERMDTIQEHSGTETVRSGTITDNIPEMHTPTVSEFVAQVPSATTPESSINHSSLPSQNHQCIISSSPPFLELHMYQATVHCR